MADKKKAQAIEQKKTNAAVPKTEDKSDKKVTDDKKPKVDDKSKGDNKDGKDAKVVKNDENKANASSKNNDSKQENKKAGGVVISKEEKEKKEKEEKQKLEKERKEKEAQESKIMEEAELAKGPVYNIGDEVVLTKDRMGVIRFKGKAPEVADGILYGVELTDGSVGHNDGQVKGVRYFKTEGQRAMFVGYEKIRRKMNKRDHKRVASFHTVSANVNDLQKKYRDGGDIYPSSSQEDVNKDKESKDVISPSTNQDDEKDPVLSVHEEQRQRNQSLAQREETRNHHSNHDDDENKIHDSVNNGNHILSYIMRQDNRDQLLDFYANPQTHVSFVDAYKYLKDLNHDDQTELWNQLSERWQKYL